MISVRSVTVTRGPSILFLNSGRSAGSGGRYTRALMKPHRKKSHGGWSGELGGRAKRALALGPSRPIQSLGAVTFNQSRTLLWHLAGKWSSLAHHLPTGVRAIAPVYQGKKCHLQLVRQNIKAHNVPPGYGTKKTVTSGESRCFCTTSSGFSEPQMRTLCLLTGPLRWKVHSSLKTWSTKSSSSWNMPLGKLARNPWSVGFRACNNCKR